MKTRILTILTLLLSSLLPLAAQTHPAIERGFRPELAYDFNGFDTVNMSNHNLMAAIPVGLTYPVGEGLSYGVTLRYTGNLWVEVEKPNIVDPTLPPKIRYIPRNGDNAGFGWRIGFGELFEGVTTDPGEYNAAAAKWRYVTADGSEHLFWETLHEPQCIAPVTTNCDTVDANVLYSRDNSYLRLRLIGTTARIVEFPDGQRQRFVVVPNQGWQLESIYTAASTLDGNGLPTTNFVKFAWIANAATGGTDWRITDSHGREHWIRRSSGGRVTSIELKAIDGATGNATATYTPVYQNHTIKKPCLEAYDPTTSWPLDFLTRFDLPAAIGEKWAFEYELPTAVCSDTSATMTRATLPTGGQIGWTYEPRSSEEMPTAVAVRQRSMYDAGTPRVEVARKVYLNGIETHVNIGTAASPNWRADSRTFDHRVTTWGPTFGLPFTTQSRGGVAPNPDDTGRYVSSETFDCDPQAGTCSTTPDRVTYVKYEMDQKIGGGCTLADPCQIERNRRVVSERTLYVSDSGKYLDRNYSRFDGLGHYRQTDTAGTFDSANVRQTAAEYNPGTGNYQVDSNGNRMAGFTMIATITPWLLETFTETSATEASVTEKQQYCFSASTGLLLRHRRLSGSSPSSNDLLTVYTRGTGTGHPIREQRYGGDTQPLGTGALCTLALPSPDQFRLDQVWQYGSLYSARYFDSAGSPLTFFTVRNTVDPGTGLITYTRDVSNLSTRYYYDLAGRVTLTVPASGGRTQNVYTAATASTPPQVEIREWNSTGTVEMGRSQTIFDALGRVAKERRLLPNGTWSTRRHAYDTAGRKSFVSETEGVAEPVNGTTSRNFDPYGRPGEVVAADGTITSLVYRGVRQVDRTVNVRTGGTVAAPAHTASLTAETYDGQGRLWRVIEQSGASGAQVTSTYTYDQGSRLARVMTAAAEGTQNRYFNYDRRGLLVSEQHPEKGLSGNGQVTFGLFNASGQYGKRVEGPYDLRYTYDRAGRLTDISESGGRPWKSFTYGTENGTTPEGLPDLRLGKLWQSTRHNHLDLFDMDVTITETLTYTGVNGMVSRRDTESVAGSDVTSFKQTWTYDDRGRPLTVGYPACTADCPHTANVSITNAYTNGFLTAVPGYASSITYHPNGLTANVAYANAASWVQANDPSSMGRPLRINTSNTTSNWVSGDYKYDGGGNVISIGQDLYWYDLVNRLKKGTALAGTAVQDYTYDSFGNLTAVNTTRSGISTPRPISVSPATNRLTASSYDAAGNVLNYGNDLYEYDPLGMVQRVSAPGKNWFYIYTPSDERIWSFDYGGNTSYWRVRGLDGKVLTEMINASDNWIAVTNYVYRDGGTLLASHSDQRASWPTRWYAVDHLGTPRQILNVNRQVLALHHYYPFGEEASAATQDGEVMKFTGHERDFCCDGQPSYVDYMHARYYTPFGGRFLSTDPVLANVHAPQSLNRYAYVANNPANLIDPFGKWWCEPGRCYDGITVIARDPDEEFLGYAYGRLSDGTRSLRTTLVRELGNAKHLTWRDAPILREKRDVPCQSFGQRWLQSFGAANGLPGITAPTGLGMITARKTAEAMGGVTPLQWARSGFAGATLRGVAFTPLETGVIAGAGTATNFFLITAAYEGGAAIGATINASLTDGCM